MSELLVANKLLSLGYNVFRAVSPSCPCDLAILKSGNDHFELQRVEVTTGYRTANGKLMHSKKQNGNFDILAVVVANQEVVFEPELFPLPPL